MSHGFSVSNSSNSSSSSSSSSSSTSFSSLQDFLAEIQKTGIVDIDSSTPKEHLDVLKYFFSNQKLILKIYSEDFKNLDGLLPKWANIITLNNCALDYFEFEEYLTLSSLALHDSVDVYMSSEMFHQYFDFNHKKSFPTFSPNPEGEIKSLSSTAMSIDSSCDEKSSLDTKAETKPLTAMDIVLSKGMKDEEKVRRLEELLKSGKTKLEENYSDDNNNGSILHMACQFCGPSVLKWLLEKKPDLIDTVSNAGTNPLFYAAKFNNEPAVNFFLKHKDSDQLINDANKYGQTLPYFAALSGNPTLLKGLLEIHKSKEFKKGCGSNIIKNLEYAIKKAIEGNHPEILKYLIALDSAKAFRNHRYKNAQHLVHLAAASGREEMVRELVKHYGIDIVNWTDAFGETSLHKAVQSGNLGLVKFLMGDCKAEHKRNKRGIYPLHQANNPEIIRYLHKERGIDVNLPTNDEYKNTALHLKAFEGHVEAVKELLKLGAKIQRNEFGRLPWHSAADNKKLDVVSFFCEYLCKQFEDQILELQKNEGMIKNAEKIAQLLSRFIKPWEQLNNKRETLLHIAARNGDVALATYLIKKGAIQSSDIDGNYPIHVAVMNGHLEIVKLFYENYPKEIMALQENNQYGDDPLSVAVINGYIAVVKYLVETAKAKPSFSKEGWHPFHYIARYCIDDEYQQYMEIFNYLKEKFPNDFLDFNLPKTDEWKDTPLHEAARSGNLQFAKFLINECKVELKDNEYKWTAVHKAAESGKTEILLFLVEKWGVKILTSPNSRGNTPLDLAIDKGHFNTVITILELLKVEEKSFASTIKNALVKATGKAGNYLFCRALINALDEEQKKSFSATIFAPKDNDIALLLHLHIFGEAVQRTHVKLTDLQQKIVVKKREVCIKLGNHWPMMQTIEMTVRALATEKNQACIDVFLRGMNLPKAILNNTAFFVSPLLGSLWVTANQQERDIIQKVLNVIIQLQHSIKTKCVNNGTTNRKLELETRTTRIKGQGYYSEGQLEFWDELSKELDKKSEFLDRLSKKPHKKQESKDGNYNGKRKPDEDLLPEVSPPPTKKQKLDTDNSSLFSFASLLTTTSSVISSSSSSSVTSDSTSSLMTDDSLSTSSSSSFTFGSG